MNSQQRNPTVFVQSVTAWEIWQEPALQTISDKSTATFSYAAIRLWRAECEGGSRRH